MKNFSERQGLTPVSEIIQTDSMTEELRNSLWNVLDLEIWSAPRFINDSYGPPGEIDPFSLSLWVKYFKKPIDERPHDQYAKMKAIRTHFFSCEWYQVYDFLEFVVFERKRSSPELTEYLNIILERELSGYRFVARCLTNITSQEEIDTIEEVVRDSEFSGVSAHISRALSLYADRDNPDFRNSIKESISAVEGIARMISGRDKSTLGEALTIIEKNGQLHPALKEGFKKLYGYTSDEDGIRHAMLDEPNLTAADARYFLVSCSAFVNYLKVQIK